MSEQHFLDRRAFLRFAAVGVTGGAALALAGCNIFETRKSFNTVNRIKFRNSLHIPPLAKATRRNGTSTFDLTAQAGTSAIVPEGKTSTWGVNGPLLGPTLRAKRGEAVHVNVTNELAEATTWHWHGMHLPAEADGGPHQLINPGATWSPSWTINQPAATLWYHPHPHRQTERHIYRGLSGLFIIDDDEEASLALPRQYGVDDIPVFIQDKTFDADGQLAETNRHDSGMLGNTMLVNGTAAAVLDITSERTRLRILNASTARSYALGFSDDRSFMLIASDGGLLHEPIPLARIVLTPGERAEIVVEMSAQDQTILRSFPQPLGLSENMSRQTGALDTLDLLLLRASERLRSSPTLPAELASIEPLEGHTLATTREFVLGHNTINGETVDMDRIDEVISVGTTEMWDVWNDHDQPHNFHVHDVQCQILDIDGQAPPPELSGWKDTVYVPPQVHLRLLLSFRDYTNPVRPYMYHCHLLWHEDQGMMGQFVVVAPGQAPEPTEDNAHHG